MKDKKITFSKLPYVSGKLCMTLDDASDTVNAFRRNYLGVTVRTFKRTVKAGGVGFAAYAVVARKNAL
jgi:hypothetical protein